MKSYLDELMNMAVHHLVGGHVRDPLELFRHHNLVFLSHDRPSIHPDVGPYFLLPLISSLALLGMGNDLFDGDTWRSSAPFVQGRSGRAFLRHFFLFLLLHNLQPLRTDTGKGLILLRLDFGIQLLVKLCHHLCRKEKQSQNQKKKAKGRKDDPFSSIRITYASSLPDELHGGHSEKALVLNNDEPKFVDQPARQNLQ